MAIVERRVMLAAELRYIRCVLAFFAAIAAAVWLAILCGKAAHYSAGPTMGLALIFLFAIGVAAVWNGWSRTTPIRSSAGEPVESDATAIYSPFAFAIAMLGFGIFTITFHLASLTAIHWKHGVESLALSCVSVVLVSVTCARDLRRRILQRRSAARPHAPG